MVVSPCVTGNSNRVIDGNTARDEPADHCCWFRVNVNFPDCEASLGMASAAARDLRSALHLNPGFSIRYAPAARRLLRQVGP